MILSTILDSENVPMGCGCAQCANHDYTQHTTYTGEATLPIHDAAVLAGGGGTVTPPAIGINNASELLIGMEWGDGGGTPASVTYSFPSNIPVYYPAGAQEQNDFQEFTADMKAATHEILDMIETFANITFTEDTSGNDGDITLARAYLTTANSDPGAWAYYPDQGDFSGDVWTNTNYNYLLEDTTKGNVGYFILLHEVMHSVGLQHSFSAGLTGNEATEQYTVTSYDWSSWGATYAETFMLYDVAAVQAIYGANTTHNTADDVYMLEPVRSNTIWDAGGMDTIDSTLFTGDVIIHLEEGGFSSIGEVENVAIAYGAVIENAITGAGNDDLYGNDADNTLTGGAGADNLFGGDGQDIANYDGSNAGVNVDLLNGIIGGGDATGDTYTDIEGISGSAYRDYIWGDNDANALLGSAGNDILEGRGGADMINGGAGWDYVRYTASTSGVNLNLDTNINTGGDADGDIVTEVESIVGSNHDDVIIGNAGTNFIFGAGGDDTLDGGGGNDYLYGQAGSDDYIYTAGKLTITETTGGNDRVVFDPTWTQNNVTVNGNTITIDATNTLTFNDITLIEWFSFAGQNDITLAELMGGTPPPPPPADDDIFIATAAAENFDGALGTDMVDFTNSTAGVKVDLHNDTALNGYAAGDDYNDIENLNGSSARDWFWGDGADNALYGMGGNDILEGGAGADVIDGGAGWDYARYTRSGGGIDVNLDTNVNTGADAEGDTLYGIETLMASNHNDTITGTDGTQFLYGLNGADTINGGNGADFLYGGADADVFLFDAITAYNGTDNINDFSLTQGDAIDLADLLTGYDPATDAIEDFVQITDSGANSIIAVDANGTGAAFINIAQVLNVTGLEDETALVNAGTLIVA